MQRGLDSYQCVPVRSSIMIAEGPCRSHRIKIFYTGPGSKDTRVFYFTRMRMTIECEFGCDCDSPVFRDFKQTLEPSDLDRLIREKIARARRYIELQENISCEFKND